MKAFLIILSILASIILLDADISISFFNRSFRVILNDGCANECQNQEVYLDSSLYFEEWIPVDTVKLKFAVHRQKVVFEDTIKRSIKSNKVTEFIEENKDAIIDSWASGVLPSVKMAQAIIESASGTSDICVTANNYFGVKCHTCDSTYNGWRIFESKESSFKYLDRIYNRMGRYKHLINEKDILVWCTQLRECGYATSESYPNSLMYNIMLYDLHKLDKIAFNKFSNT